jgi:hypothetical protein
MASYNGRMNPNITTEPENQNQPASEASVAPSTQPKAEPEAPKPATPLQIRESLHLGDTRADRAIAVNVASGISIQQQVEARAKELLMKKRNGRRLTKGEQNLIDFYHVDLHARHPSGAQQADMLRRAESVSLNLRWLR